MFLVILLFSCVLYLVCPQTTAQSLVSQVKSLRTKFYDIEEQIGICGCGDKFSSKNKGSTGIPEDCWGHKMRNPAATTGWYKIKSPVGKRKPLEVYCDMDTAGGGWTVFLRRINGRTDFNRNYVQYRIGFGNRVEFWLGNDAVHALTLHQPQQLRVDLCDWDGSTAHATYQCFSVGRATDKFRLNAEGYRGNAGDALARCIMCINSNLNITPYTKWEKIGC